MVFVLRLRRRRLRLRLRRPYLRRLRQFVSSSRVARWRCCSRCQIKMIFREADAMPLADLHSLLSIAKSDTPDTAVARVAYGLTTHGANMALLCALLTTACVMICKRAAQAQYRVAGVK